MDRVNYWVNHLELSPHPEGGFYKETYRSNDVISEAELSGRFPDERNTSTAIYFLLRSQDRSLFHRIRSDELWHFHDGSPLHIYILTQDGVVVKKLGLDIEQGQLPQHRIPAGCWFGARVDANESFTLASCTVAPGFDFHDFELAKRNQLIKQFPEQEKIIQELTV